MSQSDAKEKFPFVGRTIIAVGALTVDEATERAWSDRGGVSTLVLDDRSILYATREPESEDGGALVRLTDSGDRPVALRTQEECGVLGRSIVAVADLSLAEHGRRFEALGPDERPPAVLVLEDGSCILPLRDEDGTGPGVLSYIDPEGDAWEIG